MRVCLFCSERANSLEDAWPLWMVKQFRSERPAEVRAERHGVALAPWKVYHPSMPIRCVCRACNNGWMSRLETDARPFIEPMLRGERQTLDAAGQGMAALWIVKTAMVMEAQDKQETRAYSHLERRQLSRLSTIPWRSAIWLSACTDPSIFLGTKTRHIGPASGEFLGSSTTMSFAHISMQTLRMQVPESVGPTTNVTVAVRCGDWNEATLQIWPPRQTHVHWPPEKGLNGEVGLTLFVDRFSTAGAAPDDVQALAV
jgi:hypothetical protein